MKNRSHGAVSASCRMVCMLVSVALAAAPLGAAAKEGMGRVSVPGVYGFLPLNSGPYLMNANAQDKDGKGIECDDYDWQAINPIGGSNPVINRSLSGPGSMRDSFAFHTGSGEGAARVEVKCEVKGKVVAEGFALVSTKRGEKGKEGSDQPAPAQAAASGGGGGMGGALLLGGLVAGAAALAGAAGSGSSGGSSSSGGSCPSGTHQCTPPNSSVCCPNGTTIYCTNSRTCTNLNSGTFGNLCGGNQGAASQCGQ